METFYCFQAFDIGIGSLAYFLIWPPMADIKLIITITFCNQQFTIHVNKVCHARRKVQISVKSFRNL